MTKLHTHRLRLPAALALLVAALALAAGAVSAATTSIQITGLAFISGCSYVQFSINAQGYSPGDGLLSVSVTVVGGGTNFNDSYNYGTPAVYAAVNASPGAQVSVSAQVGAVSGSAGPITCPGGGGGGGGGGGAPAPSGDSSWGGYTDGRLNPDIAESYTVYCKNGQLEVWRAAPSSQMLAALALEQVAALPDGGQMPVTAQSSLSRAADTLTLAGTDGNRAPNLETKVFSRAQCLGDLVQAVPPSPVPPRPTPTSFIPDGPDLCAEFWMFISALTGLFFVGSTGPLRIRLLRVQALFRRHKR
jgi:hypothetical protein